MRTYSNMFHHLLDKVGEEAGWVLQLVHEARGTELTDYLEAELARANIPGAKRHLQKLKNLDLVECINSIWKTTWTGAGVSNWRTQLFFAEQGQPVPEPREGENGHQPGPGCNEFRPTFFAPGYCWCCRLRKDHASEAVKLPRRRPVKPAKAKAKRDRLVE